MNIQENFSSERLLKVLIKDIKTHYKTFLWIAGATAVVLLITYLAWGGDMNPHSDDGFNEVFFPLVLMIGGFWFSAGIYRELNTAQERQLYLSLPASTLEKYTSKFLLSSIGFIIAVIIFYSVFNLIGRGLVNVIYGHTPPGFNPFGGHNLLIFKLYLVLQSIFLLGGIAFDKFAFFKTNAAIMVTCIGVLLVSGLFFYLIFGTLIHRKEEGLMPSIPLQEFANGPLETISKYLFYALAPLFWVIGYFRLKEKEV
jgi:hypothetical protein